MIFVNKEEMKLCEEQKQDFTPNEGVTLETLEIDHPIEVSLNSVAGLPSLQTMKLQENIVNQLVVAMIDLEATHNFIARSLVWGSNG